MQPQFFFSIFCLSQLLLHIYTFFCEQVIFDPRPEYCLRFSKNLPQEIV